MKVLQITAFSGWGCTGRIALGIHDVLVAQNCESVIAWGRKNTAPAYVPTIKIGNYMDQQIHGFYTRITDRCGFGSKSITKEFIKKIDEYQPDLIQMHIMHGYYINLEILFNFLKQRNIPVVWTFHDCWAFTGHCPYFDIVGCEKWKTGCFNCPQKKHHPKSWLLDNSKLNWKDKKRLFTSINNLTIVTPSQWLADLVKQSFFKEFNILVINNGININDFKPTKGCIHKKLQIEGKKIVLGVSSSWATSKGIDDFSKLSYILPDEYRIVLVGLDEKQKKNLPPKIIGINRTDNVNELAELYTAAEVFVNPTYEDNYPTTNLEALSCGTPVITYNTGGSVEAVQESGNGLIVPKGDVRALLNSIEKISCYRKRDVYSCDADENYKRYISLYKQILGV